jgi:hypothetical protein
MEERFFLRSLVERRQLNTSVYGRYKLLNDISGVKTPLISFNENSGKQ